MAHKIYQINCWKKCPRCNSEEATISIFHFGATYQAQCSKCGLRGRSGDDNDTAIASLVDCYFEWEEKNSAQQGEEK